MPKVVYGFNRTIVVRTRNVVQDDGNITSYVRVDADWSTRREVAGELDFAKSIMQGSGGWLCDKLDLDTLPSDPKILGEDDDGIVADSEEE
ncbi:MAG: hypothetical protein HY673_14200 [Chloroflexi bacterium]|nr:hypothetical protein [Chloroflexota bacterium]